MTSFFYSKLAGANLLRQKNIYGPYLLAGTLIVMLFYILQSVSVMAMMSSGGGMGTMSIILEFCSGLCGVLSVFILFYINSFVMKRRKKEFGLYEILGMEKKHIALVVLWEVFYTSALSLVLGIAGGALLSQLMFLVLLKLARFPAVLTFQIPLSAVAITAVLYFVCFLVLCAYDILSIRRANPIELLHSENTGEREPRARWLVALFGVLTLGGGYYLALSAKNASDGLAAFFPAALLVIIGTYFLFTAGSIALLKALRRNKKFYYQPRNFVSVSGMMYRMKQNAAGLATICILSTSVLVTLSSTVCLFLGEEDALRAQYPRAISVSVLQKDAPMVSLLREGVAVHAEKYGIQVENESACSEIGFFGRWNEGKLDAIQDYNNGNSTYVTVIPLSDYNLLVGAQETLEPGEILMTSCEGKPEGETAIVLGQGFRIKKEIPVPDVLSSDYLVEQEILLVVPDWNAMLPLRQALADLDGKEKSIILMYDFDLSGTESRQTEFFSTLREELKKTVPNLGSIRSVSSARQDFYQLYGSLLFVGILFSVLFLIAAVLIIYYKQITEGYDDRSRFQIMQKVGMSQKEVRGTIRKQVLIVFFLPLGTAIVHIAVAFPVLLKMLLIFRMTNTPLFVICVACTVLIFTALYYTVYQMTARTYYKIVESD